jgi:hypothetical protein
MWRRSCSRRAIAVFVTASWCIGCRGGGTDRAEHVTPAHKPLDYAAAVERLEDLRRAILAGQTRSPNELDWFVELQDVARWLPELAADSDLEEASWNRVDEVAQRLVDRTTAVLMCAPGGRVEAFRREAEEFDALQRELAGIVPQTRGAAPAAQ